MIQFFLAYVHTKYDTVTVHWVYLLLVSVRSKNCHSPEIWCQWDRCKISCSAKKCQYCLEGWKNFTCTLNFFVCTQSIYGPCPIFYLFLPCTYFWPACTNFHLVFVGLHLLEPPKEDGGVLSVDPEAFAKPKVRPVAIIQERHSHHIPQTGRGAVWLIVIIVVLAGGACLDGLGWWRRQESLLVIPTKPPHGVVPTPADCLSLFFMACPGA